MTALEEMWKNSTITKIINDKLPEALEKANTMKDSIPVDIPDETLKKCLIEDFKLPEPVINIARGNNGLSAKEDFSICIYRDKEQDWDWRCQLSCKAFSEQLMDIDLTEENIENLDNKEYELWVKNLTIEDIDFLNYVNNAVIDTDGYDVKALDKLYKEAENGKQNELFRRNAKNEIYLVANKDNERQVFDYIKIALLNDLKPSLWTYKDTDYKHFIMERMDYAVDKTDEKYDLSAGLQMTDSIYIKAFDYVASNILAEREKAFEKEKLAEKEDIEK